MGVVGALKQRQAKRLRNHIFLEFGWSIIFSVSNNYVIAVYFSWEPCMVWYYGKEKRVIKPSSKTKCFNEQFIIFKYIFFRNKVLVPEAKKQWRALWTKTNDCWRSATLSKYNRLEVSLTGVKSKTTKYVRILCNVVHLWMKTVTVPGKNWIFGFSRKTKVVIP